MPGKCLLQQVTLRQANISLVTFKADSVINLLLKEQSVVVLAQNSTGRL
jgi:hypothetical protein